MNVPVPHHVLTLCAGADSLLMESSRRVVGAGKRKGLNPVKQVLVQPHEANNTSTETSTRLTDSPEKEVATSSSMLSHLTKAHFIEPQALARVEHCPCLGPELPIYPR